MSKDNAAVPLLDQAVPCEGRTSKGAPCSQPTKNADRWCRLCKFPPDPLGQTILAPATDLVSLVSQPLPAPETSILLAEDEVIDLRLPPETEDQKWAALISKCKSSQEEALLLAMKQNDLVPILYGPPGIGKTETIKTVARGLGADLEIVVISQKDPTDISGQPYAVGADSEDPQLKHLLPPWAKKTFTNADQTKRTIIFFDELDKAPPANQNAALTILRERMIEGQYFPRGTIFVAAANPPESGGWDFSDAMANRLVHLHWESDFDSTVEGLSSGTWDDSPPDSDGVSDGLKKSRIKYRALLDGFLRRSPQNLHSRPKTDDKAGGAWPSPRTWEGLAKSLAEADNLHASETSKLKTIYGCVGEGTGREFAQFVKEQDLPDPEDVLKHPDNYVGERRVDKLFTTVSAVSATVVNAPSQERIDQTIYFLNALCKEGKEDAVVQASRGFWKYTLDRIAKKGDIAIPSTEQFPHLIKALQDAHLIQPGKGK